MASSEINILGPFILSDTQLRIADAVWPTSYFGSESLSAIGYGWYAMGSTPTYLSLISRLDFSNETAGTSTRGSATYTAVGTMMASTQTFGWIYGGYNGSSSVGTYNKVTFSNDTVTASAPTIFPSNHYAASTGNENYGYVFGGAGPNTGSSINRLTYSNNTHGLAVNSTTDLSMLYQSSTTEGNYSWIAGNNPVKTSVQRYDFSNDSTSPLWRGSITTGYSNIGLTSAYFGWFVGGNAGAKVSSVNRIMYASDTANAVSRGPWYTEVLGFRGSSSYNTVGYLCGNNQGPAAYSSSVGKYVFSNDTASAVGVDVVSRFNAGGFGGSNG